MEKFKIIFLMVIFTHISAFAVPEFRAIDNNMKLIEAEIKNKNFAKACYHAGILSSILFVGIHKFVDRKTFFQNKKDRELFEIEGFSKFSTSIPAMTTPCFTDDHPDRWSTLKRVFESIKKENYDILLKSKK